MYAQRRRERIARPAHRPGTALQVVSRKNGGGSGREGGELDGDAGGEAGVVADERDVGGEGGAGGRARRCGRGGRG